MCAMSVEEKKARARAARQARAEEQREIAYYSNEPSHDERPAPAGSEDEKDEFQFYLEQQLKPEEIPMYSRKRGREECRARYLKFLQAKGVDPASFESK